MKKTILMVDGYSSGNFLPPMFREKGFDCVHVQSTPEIFPVLKPSFVPTDYVANFPFDGNVNTLVNKLKDFSIFAVLPGTETGVPLADHLSEVLGLPTNGSEKSAARRNKYEMIENARRCDLPVARQMRSDSPGAISQWKEDSGFDRIVVKPLESAGTDHVAVCRTPEEIAAAVSAIVGKTNMLGLMNDAVLAQEFLAGTEYFVNSVSRDGHHHITDIWKHRKRPLNGKDFVYDRAELCPLNGAVETPVHQYALKTLDAFGIQYGPTHTEIMVTTDGPRLIELGTRIQGMSLPTLNQACIGYGPLDLTVDSYVDSSSFATKASAPYALKKHALRVNLISHRSGKLKGFPGDEPIRALPSFFYLRWIKAPGMQIGPTVDYFTVPGFVALAHEDPAQLESDYAQVREWEEQEKVLAYE